MVEEAIARRSVLGLLAAAGFAGLAGRAEAGAEAPGFTMWHSPGCGCCLEWVKRVEASFGRKLRIVETADLAAIKRAHGVPADLQSCHTARIAGYVVEGHVPPEDIKRLMGSRNARVKGLAVPGMPAGAPGMDVGHDLKVQYQVFAFGAGGTRAVFATHGPA
jgi:hypothetical protein